MNVLPVPVANVSKIRDLPSPIASVAAWTASSGNNVVALLLPSETDVS